MMDADDEYVLPEYSPKNTEECPEVPFDEPLVIRRMGRSFLQNVTIDSDNPALLVGWYDERVKKVVNLINEQIDDLPDPPPYFNLDEELTVLEFKDAVHRQLRQLGGPKGGSFSNIIAPCTLDQVMDMVQRLGEIQRHPFMQAAVSQLRPGALALCGTCLDNRTCEVIPLNLFVPPPPTIQIFA